MVSRSEGVKNFLSTYAKSDLAELYNYSMEVQVNVAQDSGTRVESEFQGKKWHAWTDGITTWKSFRIPYNANTTPTYEDKALTFDLRTHVEGIGMTGWDWEHKVSKWVAYDFDAIVGHSERHDKKLTDVELKAIRDAVSGIPWVTTRRSTSGSGLHLYVKLRDIPTNNHNEHAALARSIIGTLSAITGYDLNSRVDTCGGNMWVWHRKMAGTNGLELLDKGTYLDNIPSNWRDHVKVVSGKRKRTIPADIIGTDTETLFEELSGQRPRRTFDEDHKRLIEYLDQSGFSWSWDQDSYMLVTHTYALKKAHEDLGLKGIYDTISVGKEAGDINCFCYPAIKGSWEVRRYTPGVNESDSWAQDGQGWTFCYFNKKPDLRIAARSFGGIEDEKGAFNFREAEMAQSAALALGVSLDIPPFALTRPIKLREHKDGRLHAEMDAVSHDKASELKDWLNDKGKVWKKIFNVKVSTPSEALVGNYDDTVRELITEQGEDFCWVIKTNGQWVRQPKDNVKTYLTGALQLKPSEANQILGSSIAKPWVMVNRPFQPEYVGDRKWNRDSAQLRFSPNEDLDNLKYPTWLKILEHCGNGLDDAIKVDKWCMDNGIIHGADYLKCWISSLIKEPTEPLPYLFFHGPQTSGKSIFHEAIEVLMTKGVERADAALINQSGFNAEIENAVLCVIEETDLRHNKQAYNRIKDWVTSRRVSIHRKGQTPYSVLNTTHWIQCSNNQDECPIMPGDSRITMLYVGLLDEGQTIPKKELIPMLEKEAPDFLASVLNLELPRSTDRLNIPVVETQDKKEAEMYNRSMLEAFLDEICYYIPGSLIKLSDFDARFKEWLEPEYHSQWSKNRIGRELPKCYPKGRSTLHDSQFYIGNISFDPDATPQPEFIVVNNTLRIKGN